MVDLMVEHWAGVRVDYLVEDLAVCLVEMTVLSMVI